MEAVPFGPTPRRAIEEFNRRDAIGPDGTRIALGSISIPSSLSRSISPDPLAPFPRSELLTVDATSDSVGENGPLEVENALDAVSTYEDAAEWPRTVRAEALCSFNATSASSSALDAASVHNAIQSTGCCCG